MEYFFAFPEITGVGFVAVDGFAWTPGPTYRYWTMLQVSLLG